MEVYSDSGAIAAKLMIERNVVIRMAEGAYLQAGHPDGRRGFFAMEAAGEEPITFTAHSDDPEPGFWDSVRQVGSSAGEGTRMRSVIFEYGTNNFVSDVWPDMLWNDHNQFNHAKECGVTLPTTQKYPTLSDIEGRILNPNNGNSAKGNGADVCVYDGSQ